MMTATAVPVHANFWSDVRVHLLGLLTQAGVAVLPERQNNPVEVCIDYFNVTLKLIAPRPRAVQRSKQLETRSLPEDVAVGVHLIESLSVSGQSLEPHLSDRARRAHAHDWLLNNWGIHHLHVFAAKNRDELLFVIAAIDSLYLLDVLGHDDMADVELPEIILSNWPELLTPMDLVGGEAPTKEQIDLALRSGAQAVFPLSNGTRTSLAAAE